MPFRTQHRIVLGFITEIVIPSYDDKTIDEFPDGIDDVGGFEVARFPSVDDLEGILNDSLKIHKKVMRFIEIGAREDELPKKSMIFRELPEFLIQLDLQLQRAIIQARLQHTW